MKSKIKTIEEIKSIIGNFPRKNKKVILCNGVFDVCHVGHIRHLTYAKEKADILICSITPDKYITKGDDRPYVPENLRAINVASLEVVNYVFIDKYPTPIESIKYLEVDFFAKGFEYKDGNNPKTKEEIDAINSYGGKCLYTPNDVLCSSTKLLSIYKPNLCADKLLTIMESENITFDDLLNTLEKFKDIRAHVIGDTIIDKYSYCSLLGATTKTPTFSIKRESEKMFIGGAGIVAKHLRSLGSKVLFTTVLGNDNRYKFVIDDLTKLGIFVLEKIIDNRPTTLKERFWCNGYKLLQVDTVDNSPISKEILEDIGHEIEMHDADIIIFSDFRHGIFNQENIKYFTRILPKNTIKIADSQVSNRWGNILDFKNFDIIFPNEKEARYALGDQDTGIRPLGLELYKQSGAKYLILKLGERGSLTYRGKDEKPKDFFALDSFVENLIDSNGAGDAMLAVASLAYKASNNIVISSILGSIGAAVACEKEGNVPITIDEIKEKIKRMQTW